MESSAPRLYVFGRYTLDGARARLLKDGEPVALRPKAFDTLAYLVHRHGRLVGKEELIRALWPKVVVTDDSLVKCIQDVRSALGEDGRAYIRTVPRRGYVFEGPVSEQTDAPSTRAVDEPGATQSSLLRETAIPLAASETEPERSRATCEEAAAWRTNAGTPSTSVTHPAGAPTGRFALVSNSHFAVVALAALILAVAAFVFDERRERNDTSAASAAARAPEAGMKSVAVLPFASISADPAEDYFSDGISEELLNVLANIPGLHVPSRTSSFAFRGANADLKTIGAALGVDHVLEGSVRRAGGHVRVTAQLIDVATDSHLWSGTYDRELTNVFAIQDEIARSVAAALEVRLLGDPLPERHGSRTDNVEAHDAYLLGLHGLATQRSEEILRARESFLRAIRLDPEYAAAHAALALAVLTAHGYGLMKAADALAEAAQAVERALALAPNLPDARTANATLSTVRGDYETAETEYRRAIELNPAFSLAHFGLFSTLGRVGRVQEARAALERALELDPLNGFMNWWMGNARLSLGDAEGARMYYRRGIEFEPSQANSYSGVGDTAIVAGRLDEGLRWYREGLARDPGQAHMTTIVGLLYHSLGDTERARVWFEHAAPLYQDESLSRLNRELEPLLLRNTDPDALLGLLRDVPRAAFSAFGTRLFRKAALRTGNLEGIEQFLRTHWPELFESTPRVDATNYAVAIDVAWLAFARREPVRAEALLEHVLEIVSDPAARPIEPVDWGMVLVETEAFALLGDEARALDAFRRAVEAGWRFDWWQVEHDPTLASIRNTPELSVRLARIRSDLAVQLQRIRDLERTGTFQGWPGDN